MLGQYLPLLALFVLSAVFAAASLSMSRLLAPRRPTVPKMAPYECGIVPARDTPERFPVRFFLVAMIFIVFDVEIILFYPYAVARGGLGLFGLVVVLVFTFAVFESFLYLIGAGALEWGSPTRARPVARTTADDPGSPIVSADRTATTTVRRVGLEGRWDARDARGDGSHGREDGPEGRGGGREGFEDREDRTEGREAGGDCLESSVAHDGPVSVGARSGTTGVGARSGTTDVESRSGTGTA